MSTAELKSTLHNLIDRIQDSKTLSLIYKFVFKRYKETQTGASDEVYTHFTAESSLVKDWNKPEEDNAWKSL